MAGVIVLVIRPTTSVGTDGVRDKTNNKNLKNKTSEKEEQKLQA